MPEVNVATMPGYRWQCSRCSECGPLEPVEAWSIADGEQHVCKSGGSDTQGSKQDQPESREEA